MFREMSQDGGASPAVEEGKVGPLLWELMKDTVTRLGSPGTGEHRG